MVGRCLVCSRLISTWVSSLEPPPSTPSLPFTTTGTAGFHHQRRIHLSRGAPLKVHVRFICLTSSHHGFQLLVSLPREPRATRSLPSPSASPGRSSRPSLVPLPPPPPPSSSPRIPSFSHGSPILGALFCLVPSIPRASLPRGVPGLRSLHPFPGENAHPSPRPPPPRLRLARCLLSPANSSPATEGGRSFTPPASIRCFYACLASPPPPPHTPRPRSLNPGFRQWPRVQSTRPSARRRYRFHTDRAPAGAGAGGWRRAAAPRRSSAYSHASPGESALPPPIKLLGQIDREQRRPRPRVP